MQCHPRFCSSPRPARCTGSHSSGRSPGPGYVCATVPLMVVSPHGSLPARSRGWVSLRKPETARFLSMGKWRASRTSVLDGGGWLEAARSQTQQSVPTRPHTPLQIIQILWNSVTSKKKQKQTTTQQQKTLPQACSNILSVNNLESKVTFPRESGAGEGGQGQAVWGAGGVQPPALGTARLGWGTGDRREMGAGGKGQNRRGAWR